MVVEDAPAADRALAQADALHTARRYAEAVAAYRVALAAAPELHAAWYGLGCASLSLKHYAAAAEALRRAVALRPEADGARCNFAEALFQLGDVDGAVAEYQRAADGGDPEVRSVALAGIACIAPGATHQDNFNVMAARRRWIDWQARGVVPVTLPAAAGQEAAAGPDGAMAGAPAAAGRKLRVGYLGAFYGARNWMKMYMGVINAHDRDRDHDEDRIWEIGGVSNAELAQHIADAGLDVLVDLNGYSYQRRLPLFLYRAAPRQICWNGMYGTTGLDVLDLLVGDASVIPPEEAVFCTEAVARVPGTYLAFDVFYPVPDVAPPPCRASGHLTFGCFASCYKLTDQTLAAHAAILRGAPDSRLLLRNRALDEAGNRDALVARFAALGIGTDRLLLDGGAEHEAFLRDYERVDVALDSFPYNGGTTTAEALWQGVPMLTCNGDRWAGRTSRSLLDAGGLSEWVAADIPGFIAAAIRLATAADTADRLAALRAGMRARLRASAACDVTGLCRSLEALYVQR
jgi:hypothetical protein